MSCMLICILSMVPGAEPTDPLHENLQQLNPSLLPDARAAARMLADDARSRRDLANRASTERWERVRTKREWETFRAQHLERLRTAVGFDGVTGRRPLNSHVTKTLTGRGFRVQCILFESKPGLIVTANLYLPEKTHERMPGIVLAHSHHNPKSEAELQEMGIGWARQGCAVVVPDLLGHGERRQHPFTSAADFSGNFRPGRQDYYFRYVTGMQLHLHGQSLCGWLATDLSRCVDLLYALPRIDKTRILLFGAVAGGGDPAAVAAALDERITMAAIFNFGGPQPESSYPLPDDVATRFNFAGGGSWESTRNLAGSCSGGFLPWVIVGSIAPRKLVYAHEFSWDRAHDPVWARLQKIWGWYHPDDLAGAHGTGTLTGKAPDASHCNNIGRVHRASMAPALKRWFDLEPPLSEPAERRTAADLRCVTSTAPLTLRPLHELLHEAHARPLQQYSFDKQRLSAHWRKRLDAAEEPVPFKISASERTERNECFEERIVVQVDATVLVPMIILRPRKSARTPVVVALAQEGKGAFLRERYLEIAGLLRAGIAIALPDLRGTGETRPGEGRGRSSSATSISSTELMLGRTLLGLRLRDLRAVVHYVRTRPEFDSTRVGIWGDSFAPPNSPNTNVAVPLDADPQPRSAEPLGGVLALFVGLFEKDIRCIAAHGGIVNFASMLESPFVYVPHDVVVPGALSPDDLEKVALALAPRPLRITGLVNGRNVLLRTDAAESQYRRGSYAGKRELMHINSDRGSAEEMTAWWTKNLAR